jgi:uncharacterized 2Fe-2S/4Fe-4S cluster protein (DUF4445 family)
MICKNCTKKNCSSCENIGEIFSVDFYERDEKFFSSDVLQFGIAIDIGTTTLAFELLNLGQSKSGKRIAALSRANGGRAFGADILMRISRAVEGSAASLHAYILEDIRRGIDEVLTAGGVERSKISRIAIVGNTTMLHFLQNFSVETLGVYPFTPVSVAAARKNFFGFDTFILPCVSAFIGADIVAGIHFCLPVEGNNLLIDIGTNGEIALINERAEKIFVTSAAAGPAFEGGNISAGMASVPGAIAAVKFSREKNSFICETIGNTPPAGICGTGVIDICAELLRENFIDETGLLKSGDTIEIAKNIFFTQKDIREMQLAKSAIRAGIEILLAEAQLSYENIQKVFLAGSFGYKMNVENSATLGLIPPPLKNKVHAVGNAALGGCAKFLCEQLPVNINATEINLSSHASFEKLFIEYLSLNNK